MTSDDRKAENKKVEQAKADTSVRKNTNINSSNTSSQAERIMANAEINKTKSSKGETFDKRLRCDTTENHRSPDRMAERFSKVDASEKKTLNNIQDGDIIKGRFFA